jgi:hypothetical protein
MHDIAQKQIFLKKLPELDPDPDLVVKFPDPAKRSGAGSATLISFYLFFLAFCVRFLVALTNRRRVKFGAAYCGHNFTRGL